ncbi:VOC family protein [Micromonospora sp. NPDC050686]|uniref:VOC family protein n=1 Tax=Micromonospora sp. NPDC050686 TaxID=3154631 RepID=UPI0033E928C8
MSTITDVRTIGITVADQDQALAFYRDTLGFEVRLDGMAGSTRWLEVAPPSARVSLALTASSAATAQRETGIRFTVPDAAAEHTALRGRGVRVGELLRWPNVPPMFTFDDPDGNQFIVVEQPNGGTR